jgi:hypothetical protein
MCRLSPDFSDDRYWDRSGQSSRCCPWRILFEWGLDKLIINLFKEANSTTFPHELFHLTNTFMVDNYNAGNLTDYWKRQTEMLAAEVGARKDANGKFIFDRAAMEKGAELFVDFIRTGKLQTARKGHIIPAKAGICCCKTSQNA